MPEQGHKLSMASANASYVSPCEPFAWVQSTQFGCFSLGWLNTSSNYPKELWTLSWLNIRLELDLRWNLWKCSHVWKGLQESSRAVTAVSEFLGRKSDDFSSKNNNGSFGKMFCIIPQAGVLPGHKNLSAWMQCFTDGGGSWLSLQLTPKLHPGFSHMCDSISSYSSVRRHLPVVTHLSLTLEKPWGWYPLFVQGLCSLLHNKPCGNMAKQLLRVKDRQVTDGKTSPQDWLCNRITTTNS